MKLSKFQIIAIILLLFYWFNKGGGITPQPPDLSEAHLSAKVTAGIYVLLDEGVKNTSVNRTESTETASDPKDEVEVEHPFKGRFPRVMLITDSVNCAPCKRVDSNIIQVIKTEKWKKAKWTVGGPDDAVEIIDVSKDKDKFFDTVNKLSAINDEVDGRTPTFVKFNNKGEVTDVVVGEISLDQFVKLHNENN